MRLNGDNTDGEAFTGCKLAYFVGGKLLVYRRDEYPNLIHAGLWDCPGGGREGQESPESCVLRELKEEFGLDIPYSRLIYKARHSNYALTGNAYFFAVQGKLSEIAAIRFGEEGQYWQLMDIGVFLESNDAIETLKQRLRTCLSYLNLNPA